MAKRDPHLNSIQQAFAGGPGTASGLSKLEYIATHLPVDLDSVYAQQAEALLGRPAPLPPESNPWGSHPTKAERAEIVEKTKAYRLLETEYWREVRAAFRVAEAKALLKALAE